MPLAPLPPATARIARAACPPGHRALRRADAVDRLCTDATFRALLPAPGHPAWPPWRLALATLLPCAEGRSERQAALQQRDFWPGTPIGDPGCLDAELLVESQTHDGVDRLGPTRRDEHWQARAGAGCAAQHCQSDWAQQPATCPADKPRTGGTPARDHRGPPVIKVQFSAQDCRRRDQLPVFSAKTGGDHR
jgi:hypothetical protein